MILSESIDWVVIHLLQQASREFDKVHINDKTLLASGQLRDIR